MPPQLQELLQNRRMLMIIGGALVALIIIAIVLMVAFSGGSKPTSGRTLNEEERTLATVTNMGRAIEIQALMAKQSLSLIRVDGEGGNYSLRFQDDATSDERDRALTTLVQSGLMDKNVGLEIFDKSDITASRDEKRIKLVRARNGEIARLIRKIPPIQDAAVFISIPEPTLFTQDKPKPTATVQVTLNPGERLNTEQVRSIINLLVGSVEDMEPKSVSLTDTNGEVYNSVLDSSFEVMNNLETRDRYMEQKVRGQLDKLLGNGKYVVTVATYLRESSKEEVALDYEPDRSSLSKSSTFSEGLDADQKGYGPGGPVTSDIPEGLDVLSSEAEKSSQGYRRTGKEVEFNAGKRQTAQTYRPGMLEEITVAVTIDDEAYPQNVPIDELKRLVARSASPMVNPSNVTILTKNANTTMVQAVSPTIKEVTWEVPAWIWWAAIGSLTFVVFLILMALLRPVPRKTDVDRQEDELRDLRMLAEEQSRQLQEQQAQSQQLMNLQQQQMQQLQQTQQQVLSAPRQVETASNDLQSALKELKAVLADDALDDDLDNQGVDKGFASWIES